MTPVWMEGLETLCKCRHSLEKTGITWGLFLSPESLSGAVKSLYNADFFLEDISGLDSANGMVAVYHLSAYSSPDRVALYVIVPQDDPQIPSISAVYSGARWHERETSDFFGIQFTGHPDPKPLLLPEEMTDHPLVKEEKNRAPLKDLLDPGEIVERAPGFLYFEVTDSPAPESKPVGQGSKATDGES